MEGRDGGEGREIRREEGEGERGGGRDRWGEQGRGRERGLPYSNVHKEHEYRESKNVELKEASPMAGVRRNEVEKG